MVLWSLAKLRHRPDPRFMRAAELALLSRLPQLNAADVAMAVWALGRLRYKVRASGPRCAARGAYCDASRPLQRAVTPT